jgi:hypothetical protein
MGKKQAGQAQPGGKNAGGRRPEPAPPPAKAGTDPYWTPIDEPKLDTWEKVEERAQTLRAGDGRFVQRAAAVRAAVGQGRLVDLVDLLGG